MKILIGIMSAMGVFVLWVVLANYFNDPYTHKLPWHTQGEYFMVEWIAPEGAAMYRGFASTDSAQIKYTPFRCKNFRVPPPLKPGTKQMARINYKLAAEPYDIYVEIYAFDIDGNYWNLDLLHFDDKEGL